MAEKNAHGCFIIATEGRTGSSLLASLLNHHSKVLCLPEILIKLDRYGQENIIAAIAAQHQLSSLDKHASDPQYYPLSLEAKWSSAPFAAIGFKSKVIDLHNLPAIIQRLRLWNYRLIYLHRRNPVKAVVSLFRGEQMYNDTGNWNSINPLHRHGTITVDVDKIHFALQRRALEESINRWFFSNFLGEKFIVSYEDLEQKQEASMRAILNFLRVDFEASKTKLVKITNPALREAVINYGALQTALAGTEYEQFLE